jgi:hypothetical protein
MCRSLYFFTFLNPLITITGHSWIPDRRTRATPIQTDSTATTWKGTAQEGRVCEKEEVEQLVIIISNNNDLEEQKIHLRKQLGVAKRRVSCYLLGYCTIGWLKVDVECKDPLTFLFAMWYMVSWIEGNGRVQNEGL